MSDRIPKPAPFPVGTRLRYTGTRISYSERKGVRIPITEPGLEVVVIETRPGRQGTLRQCRDEEGPMYYSDTGEPILDTTRDGYSIYEAPTGMRCIIDPNEWETVNASRKRA